jgi:hypothetical protein
MAASFIIWEAFEPAGENHVATGGQERLGFPGEQVSSQARPASVQAKLDTLMEGAGFC